MAMRRYPVRGRLLGFVALLCAAALLAGVAAEQASAGVLVSRDNRSPEDKPLAVQLWWRDGSDRTVKIKVKRGSKTLRTKTVVAQPQWKSYRLIKHPEVGTYKIYLYGGGWNGFSHKVKVFSSRRLVAAAAKRCSNLPGVGARAAYEIKAGGMSCKQAKKVARKFTNGSAIGGPIDGVTSGGYSYTCKTRSTGYETLRTKCSAPGRFTSFTWGF